MFIVKLYSLPSESKTPKILSDITKFAYNDLFFAGLEVDYNYVLLSIYIYKKCANYWKFSYPRQNVTIIRSRRLKYCA